MLSIKVQSKSPNQIKSDCLIILARGHKFSGGLSEKNQKKLKTILRTRGFKGDWGTSELVFDAPPLFGPLAVIGLGRENNLNNEKEGLRRGLASILKSLSNLNKLKITLSLQDEKQADLLASAVVESARLATYSFNEYSKRLKEVKKKQLKQIEILVNKEDLSGTRKHVRLTQQVMSGVQIARDLVNQPASNITPRKIAEMATDLAATSPNLTVKIMNSTQAKQQGFTAFLAVAKGSNEAPYVIHLKYSPTGEQKNTKKIFLVGKGITFDSGGLSLKPPEPMETMKTDMAGAAIVIGVFSVLSKLKLNHEIHGVIAACENMPSGKAYRPGDVITAMNGKTIEILNTDAEGRVTLADSLSYAVKNKPDFIIDLATLTGACIVALGETVAGLWSNNDDLTKNLIAAGQQTGEGIEPMPMPREYKTLIESNIADVQNVSSTKYGGAIVAALFLKEFVADVPWAHIDLAGPSYLTTSYIPYWHKGATGYGVRTIITYLNQLNSD